MFVEEADALSWMGIQCLSAAQTVAATLTRKYQIAAPALAILMIMTNLRMKAMTPHEELRALLGKLPNPERSMELLDKVSLRPSDALQESVMEKIAEALGDAMDCTRVWSAWGIGTMSADDFVLVAEDAERLAEIADAAISAVLEKVKAVPVIGEPDMAWNADDPEEGGYSPDEFADYVAPSLGEESVFTVALAVSQPDRKMRVWREEDADGNHEVRWEWLDTPTNPIDSIPRARLDELLAAEKRLGRLVALAKLVCESSGDNSRSIATVALKMELDVIAALSTSKAEGKGGAS